MNQHFLLICFIGTKKKHEFNADETACTDRRDMLSMTKMPK